MRHGALMVVLSSVLSVSLGGFGQSWGTHLDGQPVEELAPRGTRAVVLFFVATDCPVSNRMFPEMERLRRTFQERAVRFWFVYPNVNEQLAVIEMHQRLFDAAGDALQDRSGALARLGHAVATPEMVLLLPQAKRWKPVYAGRIDNRFVRLGVERPMATEHFGEDALNAVLAGGTPKPPDGPPVGCAINNPGLR